MTILPLAYAVVAYLIGVGGLAYMILWMAGLAPGAFGSPLSASAVGAFVGDVCLLMLWSVQHSVMARARFKDGLTKIIPAAAERSTYVLMSGAVLFVMVAFWSPMPQVIWNAQHGLARVVLWGSFIAGWTFLLVATFGTNHFELFGLRQAYLHYKGVAYSPLPFTRTGIYGWMRHPIQTGVLIGIWSVPTMHLDHLIMSSGLTIYVFVGLCFEERDLIRSFGEQYERYRAEVGGLWPKVSSRKE